MQQIGLLKEHEGAHGVMCVRVYVITQSFSAVDSCSQVPTLRVSEEISPGRLFHQGDPLKDAILCQRVSRAEGNTKLLLALSGSIPLQLPGLLVVSEDVERMAGMVIQYPISSYISFTFFDSATKPLFDAKFYWC